MSKRALLLINRRAGRGAPALAQAVESLHHLDFELITAPVKNAEHIAARIQQYGPQLDLVIVGGGDGTLNAAVDSLVQHQLPLGILPLGTANDLARTLSIPTSTPEACRVIAAGHTQPIDLGWVNGKHFFNVASLGLSVRLTESLSRGTKRRWGALAYALKAIQMVRQTRPFRAEIRCQGTAIPVKTIQIAIGNGRYYGGGMAVTDDAAIDDQRLDLYSLELQHWWQAFPLLWRLPRGQQRVLPWVRVLHGQEIEIITPKAFRINTDGELTVWTPAKFRVMSRALTIYVPQPGLALGEINGYLVTMDATRRGDSKGEVFTS
jgi:YegS/Rv2252/BmrU family lipid kinase